MGIPDLYLDTSMFVPSLIRQQAGLVLRLLYCMSVDSNMFSNTENTFFLLMNAFYTHNFTRQPFLIV